MFINGKNEIYVFVWCVFVAVSQYTVCLLNIRIKNIQYFLLIYTIYKIVCIIFSFQFAIFFAPSCFFLPFLHSLLISAYVINLSSADIEVVGDSFFSFLQFNIQFLQNKKMFIKYLSL